MRFFIDTGSVAEVEEIAAWGILSGATTNPSLLAKEKGDPGDIIRRICDLVGGPVSAEVVSDDAAGMIEEGRVLAKLHEHVVVKVPFSSEGLAATKALSDEGLRVNMTLVFSANQALLTAQAGATYASCFMGRLDDISIDSAAVVRGDRRDPAARRDHDRGPGRLASAIPSTWSRPRGSAARSRPYPRRSSGRCSPTRSRSGQRALQGGLGVPARVRPVAP